MGLKFSIQNFMNASFHNDERIGLVQSHWIGIQIPSELTYM
jgi:hypothetical protein